MIAVSKLMSYDSRNDMMKNNDLNGVITYVQKGWIGHSLNSLAIG
jgi:hypothetical protein